MKKILITFILSFILFIPKTNAIVTSSSSLDDVKIYLFCDDSSKCENAKKWIKDLESEYVRVGYKYFNVKEDKSITNNVKKSLKIRKNSLPLIVIGTNYFLGFNDNIKDEIRNAISAYEKVDEFCDITYKLENKKSIKNCIEQNENIYSVKESKFNFNIVLFIVIPIVIIILIILLLKRKKINKKVKG